VIQKTFEQTAMELAQAHCQEDPTTHMVWLDHDPSRKEVRLVEVSSAAAESSEIFAVHFEANHEIPVRSAVILLSDAEWARVDSGHLSLPDGWGPRKTLAKLV
jgi:hypothetical protein